VPQALPARGRSAEAGPVRLHCDATVRHNLVCSVVLRRVHGTQRCTASGGNDSGGPGQPAVGDRRGASAAGGNAGDAPQSFPSHHGKRTRNGPRSSARSRRPEPARILLLAPAAPVIFRLGPVAPWLLPVPLGAQKLIEQSLTTPPARLGSTGPHVPATCSGRFFAKSALPQYRSQILESNRTDIP
jgi:hypothetical protein